MAEQDELQLHAIAKVVQFPSYESNDPSVDRTTDVELVDWADGMIELAFDMVPGRKRTYLRMRLEDLKRLVRKCK